MLFHIGSERFPCVLSAEGAMQVVCSKQSEAKKIQLRAENPRTVYVTHKLRRFLSFSAEKVQYIPNPHHGYKFL